MRAQLLPRRTGQAWADKKSVSLVNFRLHFCCAQATPAQRPTGFMKLLKKLGACCCSRWRVLKWMGAQESLDSL